MNLDITFFHTLNNSIPSGGILSALAIFGATFLLPLMLVLVLPASILGKRLPGEPWWQVGIRAGLSAGVGYGIKLLIALIAFRPRPFVALTDAHLLIVKSASDSSFPSGHATVAFAIAFTLYKKDRGWGIVFLILASIVALSRVLVGVHYVSDILGGLALGWCSARLIAFFESHELLKINKRLK